MYIQLGNLKVEARLGARVLQPGAMRLPLKLSISAVPTLLVVTSFTILAGLLCNTRLSSARIQDDRPRRTGQTSPTPTPITEKQRQRLPTNVATPTPTPVSGAQVRPKLGEAPPPPRLKPKPTPTPPEEIDPESTLKINTQLVTLNVRVIDRTNRAVNDVRQSDFRVYEDGVAQPIEFFSTEQVPVTWLSSRYFLVTEIRYKA